MWFNAKQTTGVISRQCRNVENVDYERDYFPMVWRELISKGRDGGG